MAETFSTSVVIGAALGAGFGATTKSAVSSIGAIGESVKKTRSQLKSLNKLGSLESSLKEVEGNLMRARREFDRLNAKMQASPSKALEKDLNKAARAVERLEKKQGKLSLQLHRTGKDLNAAGVDVKNMAQENVRLGHSLDTLSRKYDRLTLSKSKLDQARDVRSDLHGKMLGTAAMFTAMLQPVAAAVKFETVMADIGKVVDFDTPAQFKQMGVDIRGLSTKIPMAAAGLGDIMASAGQAGIARAELLRFTSDAAKMGVAFDMAGKDAGGAMTGMRTIFSLNQDQVVMLGDSYNHLSNSMDTTARDLVNIANRAGSTAKLVGLTGQQVGALGATFLALKTPPEVAATGINAMLLKLSTADKQGKKFEGALRSMGYTAGELKQKLKRDAQGTLLEFLETVQRSPDVTGTLSDLFGTEYADDVAKLVGSLDTYRNALKLVSKETDYAGSMQAEYEERSKTTASNLTIFKSRFENLGITIGSVILPAVNTVLGHVGALATAVENLANQFPMTTTAVVGFVGALVAARAGFLVMRYLANSVKMVYHGTLLLSTKSKGMWPAMTTGARKYDGALQGVAVRSRGLAGTLGKHRKAAGLLGVAVMGMLAAGDAMGSESTNNKERGGMLGNLLGSLGGAAAGAKAGAALGALLGPAGMAVGGVLGSVVGGLIGEGAGEKLGAFLGSALDQLMDWGGRVGSVMSSVVGGALKAWFNLPGTILDSLTSLGSQMFEAGGQVMAGLVDGIKSKVGAVKDSVLSVGQSIVGWFKSDQKIKSPSRIWAGLGGHLMGGLALGIDRRRGAALASLAAVTVALAQPVAAGPVQPFNIQAPSIETPALTINPVAVGDRAKSAGQMAYASPKMEQPRAAAANRGREPEPPRVRSAVAKGGVDSVRSPVATNVTQNNYLTINQQPGESADDLAERIMAKLERQQRMGYHDHWGRV